MELYHNPRSRCASTQLAFGARGRLRFEGRGEMHVFAPPAVGGGTECAKGI
jgi:hypothetical protein